MVPRAVALLACIVVLESCSPSADEAFGPRATARSADQLQAEADDGIVCYLELPDSSAPMPPVPPDQQSSGESAGPKRLVREAVVMVASGMESYFADNNEYPSTGSSLTWYWDRPDPSVLIGIESFGADGYALVGRHADWPGASCILVAGEIAGARRYRTDRRGLGATQDDMEPICD